MKQVLIAIICIALSSGAFAQNQLAAERKAFFTEQLALTPTESKAFWPIYDQYLTELEILRLDRKREIAQAKLNQSHLSDKELESLVDNRIVFKQKEVDIEKKYNERFKQVLPIEKVAKVFLAQEAFKRRLVNKLSN